MNTTRLAATISIALALAACMTSPPAPTDTYYRLRPGEIPAAGVSQLPMSLQVQRFTADGLLRERAMLYSDDDGHRVLKQHVYHYWLDNPARLLHDYWTAQLQGSNPMQVGQSSATDYELHGRLRRMERLLVRRASAPAESLSQGWRAARRQRRPSRSRQPRSDPWRA